MAEHLQLETAYSRASLASGGYMSRVGPRCLTMLVVLASFARLAAGTEGPILLNEIVVGDQVLPVAAADAAGRVLVAWKSQADGGTLGTIRGRYFELPTGVLASSEFEIGTFGAADGPIAVAVSTSGASLVVWERDGGHFEGDRHLLGALISKGGKTLLGDLLVDDTCRTEAANPTVAAGLGNDFMILWQVRDQRTSDLDIAGRYLSASGKLGAPFTVNHQTRGDQARPTLASKMPGQGWVAAWEGPGQNAVPSIFLGVLDSPGTASVEYVLNRFQEPLDRSAVSISVNADGVLAAAWQVADGSGSTVHVFVQDPRSERPEFDELPIPDSTLTNDFAPYVFIGEDGIANVYWVSEPEFTASPFGASRPIRRGGHHAGSGGGGGGGWIGPPTDVFNLTTVNASSSALAQCDCGSVVALAWESDGDDPANPEGRGIYVQRISLEDFPAW